MGTLRTPYSYEQADPPWIQDNYSKRAPLQSHQDVSLSARRRVIIGDVGWLVPYPQSTVHSPQSTQRRQASCQLGPDGHSSFRTHKLK